MLVHKIPLDLPLQGSKVEDWPHSAAGQCGMTALCVLEVGGGGVEDVGGGGLDNGHNRSSSCPTGATSTLLSPLPLESDALSQLKSTVCFFSRASNCNKHEEEDRQVEIHTAGVWHSSNRAGLISVTAGNTDRDIFRKLLGEEMCCGWWMKKNWGIVKESGLNSFHNSDGKKWSACSILPLQQQQRENTLVFILAKCFYLCYFVIELE